MAKIALVDDDHNILTSLSMALKAEGFEVAKFSEGQTALDYLSQNRPDIGVFDIKMPRMDGLELLRRLRNISDMPVIFLTSKDDEIDELIGLKIGADDYITKPFSQKLLVERIRTILRRSKGANTVAQGTGDGAGHTTGQGSGENLQTSMERGPLSLDTQRHECLWHGKSVNLTVTEFLILKALAQRPGYVKSRDALMDAAYDDQVYVDDRTIDSHIKRLRRKFRKQDPEFDAIETLYGVGYKYKE